MYEEKKKSVFVYASGNREVFQTKGHLKGHRNAKKYIFVQPEPFFFYGSFHSSVQTKPYHCYYPECVTALFYLNPK